MLVEGSKRQRLKLVAVRLMGVTGLALGYAPSMSLPPETLPQRRIDSHQLSVVRSMFERG